MAAKLTIKDLTEDAGCHKVTKNGTNAIVHQGVKNCKMAVSTKIRMKFMSG